MELTWESIAKIIVIFLIGILIIVVMYDVFFGSRHIISGIISVVMSLTRTMLSSIIFT